jgi:hypothetical protein
MPVIAIAPDRTARGTVEHITPAGASVRLPEAPPVLTHLLLHDGEPTGQPSAIHRVWRPPEDRDARALYQAQNPPEQQRPQPASGRSSAAAGAWPSPLS